ncbi:MAG: BREX system P-loop protein BrxC, partial [bacterium]|nr:BREX system P-loop protein BrxC [bacterium]
IMYNNHNFPGMKTVNNGKGLLRAVIQIQSPSEFFKKIYSDRDVYIKFAEDYEPVKAFFAGEQKTIFTRALKLMQIYDESKTFIVDEKVEQYVTDVKAILNKEVPYGEIHKLPNLLDLFTDVYTSVLTIMAAPIIKAIDEASSRVMERLSKKSYKAEFESRYIKLFKEIRDRATTCNNVATLQTTKLEADALKVRLLNEMDRKDALIAEPGTSYGGGDLAPKTPVKKRKSISIKSITSTSSWQIESAQDLDKYLSALKEQILREMDSDTIISIEF